MGDKRFVRALAVLLLLVVGAAVKAGGEASLAEAVASLQGQDSITILITDSGLGGLSVAASLEHRLQSCHPFKNVHLVFANALPNNDHTYNSMSDTHEKAVAFDSALNGFVEHYHPSIILIACNTLSVVYPETEFAKSGSVPVYGIVDFGVEGALQKLASDSTSTAIILGTPTTAESHAHADGLEAHGISPARLTTQGCEMLESEIQADPNSDIVRTMIEMYAMEALEKNPPKDSSSVEIALCCTHYGYAKSAFKSVFEEQLGYPVTVIDPNEAMASAVLANTKCNRFPEGSVTVDVVTRAELGVDDVNSIASMLEPVSPATAEALRMHTLDTNLFTY